LSVPEPELPSQRQRRADLAKYEREHGVQWTWQIDSRARVLVLRAFDESYNSGYGSWIDEDLHGDIDEFVRVHSEQRIQATSWVAAAAGEDQWEGIPTLEYLDWLQAASIALEARNDQNGKRASEGEYSWDQRFDGAGFREKVNDIFLDRRIAHTFVGGALVPREEEPLHASIVGPASALLTSEPRFARAERAYGEALSHLAAHQAGASITSAGSSLAEVLRALGATGDTLGSLFSDARRRGFLMAHDNLLFEAYKKIADWTTADRSNRGNAHWASSAEREDAMLAVRIAGSLILRLVAVDDLTTQDGEGAG